MVPKFHELAPDEAKSKAVALEDDLLLLLNRVARQTSTFADAKAQTLGVTQAQSLGRSRQLHRAGGLGSVRRAA